MEFFLGTSGATLFGERDTLCLCPFVGKKREISIVDPLAVAEEALAKVAFLAEAKRAEQGDRVRPMRRRCW